MATVFSAHSLRIAECGRVLCEPGWHLGPEWAKHLRDHDLWFVWSGRGQMRIDGEPLALMPGTCVWMRQGRRYEATQDKNDRLSVNFIHFDVVRRGKVLRLSDFTPPFEVLHTRQLDFVDTMMRRIIELRAEGEGTKPATALLHGLLLELIREQAAADVRASGIDQHHRALILRAAARLRESAGHAPPVAELARETGYSVDHFSRVFLKVTGCRPQDYIISAKIARARQLLGESDLTIGMIADALGFRDIFFFSRQFRQRTGQTPTEFRRGLRRASI